MPYAATIHLNQYHEPVAKTEAVHVLYASDARKIVRFDGKGWETYHGELFDTEGEARAYLAQELRWIATFAEIVAKELAE